MHIITIVGNGGKNLVSVADSSHREEGSGHTLTFDMSEWWYDQSDSQQVSPPIGYGKKSVFETGKSSSLVPRPSTPPVFDRLQYCKRGARNPAHAAVSCMNYPSI